MTAPEAAPSRPAAGWEDMPAGAPGGLYGLPGAGAEALAADPPVWAPIAGFASAIVPRAPLGRRVWDKDGPAPLDIMLAISLPPAWSWAVWRRAGPRLICMKAARSE